jgi:hypothetical protein
VFRRFERESRIRSRETDPGTFSVALAAIVFFAALKVVQTREY